MEKKEWRTFDVLVQYANYSERILVRNKNKNPTTHVIIGIIGIIRKSFNRKSDKIFLFLRFCRKQRFEKATHTFYFFFFNIAARLKT